MESLKSTKTVRKKNNTGQLLSLLAFVAVLPLYGLYFHSPGMIKTARSYDNFKQDFEAANTLYQSSLYFESNQSLWALFSENIVESEKLMVLELIRRNSKKSGRLKELLRALYFIQAYDPEEKRSKYQKELFETLKKVGKDKDANLYLEAKSGLNKKQVATGSSQLVIASVGNEEVYQAELDRFILENPQFSEKKSEGLVQLIIRRILKRKSLILMEESDFQQKLDNFALEMRIAEYLKRELSASDPTEMELKSFYEVNKNDYNYPAGLRVAHILLYESDLQALQKLENQPPKSKNEFEELAKKLSRSLNKVNGGVLSDWVIDDDIPTEGNFAGVWQFLQNGSTGFHGPFKSRRGSHYFWIYEKRETSTNSYEQILTELRNRYVDERSKQIQEQYFKQLISDQQVKIFHERM